MRMRKLAGIAIGLVVALVWGAAKFAGMSDWGEHGDAPDHIEATYRRLSAICVLAPLCPVTRETLDAMKRAIARDAFAEDLLGLDLLTGDGLPEDREAGVAWVARAAEDGDPRAARDIADRLRDGAAIEVDETKIAAALQRRVATGDAEAMRALGPMIMRGRGAGKDPAGGLAMLKRAASLGSSGAEADLARLYMLGAPGLPPDRTESLKWFEASALHGDADAMVTLGYMAMNSWKSSSELDLTRSFCWLARAALLDRPQAQEKLSMMFASGASDERGAAIGADLVQADMWFRLAARSPYHDNSQIRAAIEPGMTTAELDAAKRLVADWRPRSFAELKGLRIALPPRAAGGASPGDCPAMG